MTITMSIESQPKKVVVGGGDGFVVFVDVVVVVGISIVVVVHVFDIVVVGIFIVVVVHVFDIVVVVYPETEL